MLFAGHTHALHCDAAQLQLLQRPLPFAIDSCRRIRIQRGAERLSARCAIVLHVTFRELSEQRLLSGRLSVFPSVLLHRRLKEPEDHFHGHFPRLSHIFLPASVYALLLRPVLVERAFRCLDHVDAADLPLDPQRRLPE